MGGRMRRVLLYIHRGVTVADAASIRADAVSVGHEIRFLYLTYFLINRASGQIVLNFCQLRFVDRCLPIAADNLKKSQLLHIFESFCLVWGQAPKNLNGGGIQDSSTCP